MSEEDIIETLKEMQEICRYNTYIKNEKRDEWARENKAIKRDFRFI